MTKLIAAVLGAVLLTALLPSADALARTRSCIVVDGKYYSPAGHRIKRCPRGALRRLYKVKSTRLISEPRCAGKRPGYSFIRKVRGGRLQRIVCHPRR
jgi:hypothetical protein